MNAELPPLGSITEDDHATIVAHLKDLADESIADREEWIGMAEACANIYLYGDDPPPANTTLVVHEIQKNVQSATFQQLREMPQVTLEGVEASGRTDTYWAGPSHIGASLGVPAECLAEWIDPITGQPQPPQPLPPDVAETINTLVEYGQPVQIAPGAIAPIKEDWVVQVNDSSVAQMYQTLFDVYWTRSDADSFLRKFQLDTNILGFVNALYEFDDDEQRHDLTHLEIRQVYWDRHTGIESLKKAAYAGVDLAMDAGYAKRKYPELSAKIDEWADDGNLKTPDGQDIGAVYQQNYERPMIVLRVFWLRNQPVPMTADQAMASGKIRKESVTTSNLVIQSDEAGQPMVDQMGILMMVPETREAYMMGESEVMEGSPDWPVRYVIRQITTIEDTVVDDRECEHWDIPLVLNVCNPLNGHKPYGIGEPWAQRMLQQKYSRIMANAAKYSDSYANPGCAMPAEVYEKTKAAMPDFHADPTQITLVDGDLWRQYGGKIIEWYSPAPFPESNIRIAGMLKQSLTDVSGNQDALQGKSIDASGRAIEAMQTAAASLMGFKGVTLSFAVERLARLMLHSLVWRLSAEQVGKVISALPPHILAAVHAKAQEMEWNLKVSVSTASGSLRAQKNAEVRADLAAQSATGEPLIDIQTAREKLMYDDRQIRRRLDVAKAKQAAAMQAMQPAPGAATAQPAPSAMAQ